MDEFRIGLQLSAATYINTYFSNHRERLFHDSLALQRELEAEMWPSCFWEILNENLLQRAALKFLIWCYSAGQTACHLWEIPCCLRIKIINMSPFSNATRFPIYTTRYMQSSWVCHKKSIDERTRGEASGNAQPAGGGSWGRKQTGQVSHHQEVLLKERKYNPTLVNLALDFSTGKPSDPSSAGSGKRILRELSIGTVLGSQLGHFKQKHPWP